MIQDILLKRGIIIIGAVILDILLGDPPNKFHPVAWMGFIIKKVSILTQKKNKVFQFISGMFLTISGIIFFALPLYLLLSINIPYLWLINIPLLKLSFSIKSLFNAGKQVKKALIDQDIDKARSLVAWHLVSRDTSNLTKPYIISATIESLAENLTDGIAAPLFYYLLLGLPGAWAYRFCNTCDSMIGYRDQEHEYYGKFTAKLDDLLNWLPSRLTGILIVCSVFFTDKNFINAWQTMVTQHNRTSSPNAGWTMAAMAGALEVTLVKKGEYKLYGGNNELHEKTIKDCFSIMRITIGFIILLYLISIGILYVSFS